MKKKTTLLCLPVLMLIATVAHAQGDYVNSPENPTAVLLLVGTAATPLYHRLRR